MSADNGVYILETLASNGNKYEYRVVHLSAIDNVNWSKEYGMSMGVEDVRIKNAREMWKDCKVFVNSVDAFEEAYKIEKKIEWSEYGIVVITINRIF